MKLKQITNKDQLRLKEVYFDSVCSIDENIYSKEHKFAWASQAWENNEFQKSLLKGIGSKLICNSKIIGFGTFKISKRKATTGRNPQTGAQIQIPASNAPKFSAGKALKEAVN